MSSSFAAYLLLHLFLRLSSKTCLECIQDGGLFCLDNNKCLANSTTCDRTVDYPQVLDVTCAGFTGYDTTRKLIVLSIRGSHGVHQYYDLWKVGNEK
ncbi:hypothetical protein L5515_004812 [Caenorhabditis briggsae]|uniref:Uncharacterized protein n=1 Tax=Caenorhabditis briggsae TaxID=6238 RepID=A0AAE9ER03_CAEBR|nr:hypothetical protein L5515_004812 [Caenorhabditis briggsae]